MTLQELLAHNAAIRKQREALAAKKAEEQKQKLENQEKIKETEPKSKKGRKPKNRAYLVAEELPFVDDGDVVEVVADGNDEDSKPEEEIC